MDEQVVTVTDAARRTILELRSEEDDPETLALWLEINGVSGQEYSYDLYFESPADAGPDDAVHDYSGLVVVVTAASVERLRGATLDANDEGMVLTNPNRPEPPPSASVPESDLTSEEALAVLRVLEEEVNPAIASHGGMAQLVAVEEGTVYLRLLGGCQGCGMASVTLSQGIQVAIQEAVPGIHSVVDVTDHASGTNPYFERAKK